MPITCIEGLQRGDEGKGRFADMLAETHQIVARFNGGPNAGHTVVLPDGRDLALHLIPSGIAHDNVVNVIGNGTVIDPVKLVKEIQHIRSKNIAITPDNLKISSAAHLIMPHHIALDELREAGKGAQGSTKAGIAPAYADKAMRIGMRMEDIVDNIDALNAHAADELAKVNQLRQAANIDTIDSQSTVNMFVEAAKELAPFVTDTPLYLHQQLLDGAEILAEGAQAFLLDLDHGMYGAVSSSSTTSCGTPGGLGVAPQHITRVIGIAKAIQSHVGGGPFVTEIDADDPLFKRLHGDMDQIDSETGTTTGRVRRLGYLDLPAIRRANMINGTTELALTKLDWVPRFGDNIPLCTRYRKKKNATEYDISPSSARGLAEVEPVLEKLPVWKEDISAIRQFDDLPIEAKQYIEFIEKHTGLPITMIGVGPRRDQVIVR